MGLTSVQLRVLGSVSRLEEAGWTEIHQNDLERLERVTHPAMTVLLRKLEKKGFLQCVPGTSDKRYKKITVTEKSAGIHKMILAQDEEVFSELCKNFTQEEKKSFQELVEKFLQNADPD